MKVKEPHSRVSSTINASRRIPGDTNLQKWGFDIHPEVFFVSAGLILLFVLVTLIFQEPAETAFSDLQTFIANAMGWFMILVVSIYLGIVIILAFSKFGKIRLGGQNARPEFPTFAWIAMLISAGMGIGLMFWSVAEPIYHYQTPPIGDVQPDTAAAQEALGFTFFTGDSMLGASMPW